MKTYRPARIAEVVREVASETILFELNDPRIKSVTVTRAEVSADLQHAKVYVSIMGSPSEQKVCLYGLRRATGYIQKKLGERLRSRYLPAIQFLEDKGVKNSIEVTRLIKEALAPPTQGSADGPAAEERADPPDSSL